jgi:serine/threonine protein kinase
MIGQKLGSFLIDAELGAGAMGVVYRGVRETGKTRVAAVKVISIDQMSKGKAFDRFIREAEILEQFRHPNIVKYLARGKSGKTFYYAMEYIQGATLDKILQDRGALPWPEMVRYAIQICDALHYAHDHSIVHRDLKPSNLMVNLEDEIKLTDFGIAKDLDATALTATGRTLGTAAYMAPEQIRGTPEVSHKTDLYALGILFYQMLVGDLPFQGGSVHVLMHCHMMEPPPKPSSKAEQNLPVVLDELVHSLMAKAPADRPWDAAAVSVTLRELQVRYESNQPIPMVWPEEGTAAHNPTRTTDIATFKKKSAKKKKQTSTNRLIEALPTIGLVAALFVIGGIIAYFVWPPSARYLFAKAEPLMASTDRLDWFTAQSQYLDELDRRFPDHPYKAQTDTWNDKIALSRAERRSEILEKSAVPGFKKADGQGEGLYAAVYPEADAALKRFDDPDAARRWREMAASLEKDATKTERGWLLLARKKAETVEAAIKARTDEVNRLLARADEADKANLPDQAIRLRRDILDRFAKYTDQADTIAHVRKLVPDESAPKDAAK